MILSDAIPNTILIALLLLGVYRITWGLTHRSLVGTDVEPPSDWVSSIALICSAAAIYLLVLVGKKPRLHAANSTTQIDAGPDEPGPAPISLC
jgi:hypothetical protein